MDLQGFEMARQMLVAQDHDRHKIRHKSEYVLKVSCGFPARGMILNVAWASPRP